MTLYQPNLSLDTKGLLGWGRGLGPGGDHHGVGGVRVVHPLTWLTLPTSIL